jgi:putative oxidoreductase
MSMTDGLETLGRMLFSIVFVAGGVQHIVATDSVLERLHAARFGFFAALAGPPRLLVLATGVLLIAAGLALLAGVRVRLAAVVLAALLVPISVTALVGTTGELGPLIKNVALLGGLLQLAAREGGKT